MTERDRPWEITFSAEAERWFGSLSRRDTARVIDAVDKVEERGPALRRPDVGVIKTSRYHNMKELIPRGHIRILFAFDPQRRAAVLLGGDKTDNWRAWYRKQVKCADHLYEKHLRDSGQERTWKEIGQRPGVRSAARER
jgi:hypothetical protein